MGILKGSNKYYYDYHVSDIVASNLRDRIEYGLIEMGAYTTVAFSHNTSGYTNLQKYSDTVYEGLGPSWVWQSGVTTHASADAIVIPSGVWINDTFYDTATTSGVYEHHIDYRNGRVVFANALNSDDTVACEYTFNDVGVYLGDSEQWKIVINDLIPMFNQMGDNTPSGLASYLKERRVWMPSIFIDVYNRTDNPAELGSSAQLAEIQVFYNVIANRPFDCNTLTDIIHNQKEDAVDLFNPNLAPTPLGFDGSLQSNAITYKDLASRQGAYYWRTGFIGQSRLRNVYNIENLFTSELVQLLTIEYYTPQI